MYIGICDDEPRVRDTLREPVADYGKRRDVPFNMFCFASGEELLSAIGKGQEFDLLFLDIYMDAINGISVAEKIREAGKKCAIVFATNSRDHAIESYGIRAIHYLLKPLTPEGVDQALDRAIESRTERKETIVTVNNRQGIYKIPVSDIMYAESNLRVVSIYAREQGCIEYYDKLDNFERLCGDPRFFRCHKSFLVNLDYVQSIEETRFLLKTGAEIRISIRLSEAKSVFAAYKASNI